jgi:metal-responsive CopG/Arc/MetJ family transcriptional regulator
MAKVMVSLPDDLLTDLDREAARRGSTRSALLAAGARRELAQQTPEDLDSALERVRAALRSSGSFESGDVVRAERDRS